MKTKIKFQSCVNDVRGQYGWISFSKKTKYLNIEAKVYKKSYTTVLRGLSFKMINSFASYVDKRSR